MPLEFSLYKNSMSQKGKYRAVVKNVKYVTIEHAIAALTKPGSILKETECYAVIHSLLEYINEQLAEGHGFESPYFRLKPGLKGVFEGEDDTYDSKRHKARVNFRMGKTMKKALLDLKVKKIESAVPEPLVESFEDWISGIKNQIITPQGTYLLTGEQLKIQNPDDPAQGVFLIHQPTQQVFRMGRLGHNYPTKLLALMEDTLPPGAYRLEVRSSFSTSGEIRTGRLPYTLKVD